VPQSYHSRNRLYVRQAQGAALAGMSRLEDVVPAGLRLGVQIGVVYGPEYAQLQERPAFRRLLTLGASRRALWQMLSLGRVDGVIASEVTARWELAQLGLAERIVPTAVIVSDEPAYTMFSRQSVPAELVERYRQAGEALEKDGTQARIVARYYGRD
jgi:polar amino acid transport system substrate-binding protein